MWRAAFSKLGRSHRHVVQWKPKLKPANPALTPSLASLCLPERVAGFYKVKY